jgi:hypothetical protein
LDWPISTLCLTLALSSARAGAAAPRELPAEPAVGASMDSGAGLRVDIDPAIDDATLIPAWIVARHPGLAEPLGTAEGQTTWIAVEITGATYDYRVLVRAMRGDRPLGPSPEPTRCECTTEELLVLVDAGIATATDRARAAWPGPIVPVTGSVEAPAPEPRAEDRSQIDARRGRPSRLGHAGIGVGVVGAGLVVAGAVLAVRPDEVVGQPGSIERVSYRGVGVGLAVGGSVALATGLSLLAVDLARVRRRSLALAPFVGPHRLGLSLTRRF